MNNILTQLKNSDFIGEDFTCGLNGCGDLHCISQDQDMHILLHCSPMAVEIQYTDKESSESESKNFTKSGTFADGEIEITVENRGGNVLGFAMESSSSNLTVIQYTKISLKSCSSGTMILYFIALCCVLHYLYHILQLTFGYVLHILCMCIPVHTYDCD